MMTHACYSSLNYMLGVITVCRLIVVVFVGPTLWGGVILTVLCDSAG